MLTFSSDCILVVESRWNKNPRMAGFIRRLGGLYRAWCWRFAGSDAPLSIDNDAPLCGALWSAEHEGSIAQVGDAVACEVQGVEGQRAPPVKPDAGGELHVLHDLLIGIKPAIAVVVLEHADSSLPWQAALPVLMQGAECIALVVLQGGVARVVQ